jgi:tRNA(adenine34) deaminase
MLQARIQRLVFGALDPKAGAITSVFNLLANNKLNHKIIYTGGVLADSCGQMLTEFFRARR